MRERRAIQGVLTWLTAAAAACGGAASKDIAAGDSAGEGVPRAAAAPADLVAADSTARPRASGPTPRSPLADSLDRYVVIVPRGETSFVAASRNRRLLLDLGRMDLDVRTDSAKRAAFREVVRARSPFGDSARVLLRGPWGSAVARVRGYDYHNQRIVAELDVGPPADSLARAKAPLTAYATFAPADAPDTATATPCRRTPSPLLAARVKAVRDSLVQALLGGPLSPYERLRRGLTPGSSQVTGCFGGADRVLVAAHLRTPTLEWARETVVLVDTLGAVRALTVNDLRFKVHELLHALDADGDGVDDVATRASTERAGGTTLLRHLPKERRLERLAVGFAWER